MRVAPSHPTGSDQGADDQSPEECAICLEAVDRDPNTAWQNPACAAECHSFHRDVLPIYET